MPGADRRCPLTCANLVTAPSVSGVTSSLPELAPPDPSDAVAAPRPGLRRAALVIAPASMAANVLGYVLTVVVSRALGPDGFGALGALLGLLLIGAVPALALQAVAARRVAVASAQQRPDVVRGVLRFSLLLGLGTTVVFLLAAPVVTAYLHLDGLAPAAWLAASLAPVAVISGGQGVLQGAERFPPLAVVFVVAAALRVAGGVVAVLLGAGLTGVLIGTTAGSALAAVVAVLLARRACPPGLTPAGGPPEGMLREVGLAGFGLLALVALSNVDVLLARHHLPAREAGLYAVGAVLAKAAYWAPQVVVVVVFPRLAGEAARRALRGAVLIVAGFGACVVAGTALLAEPLLRLVFGTEYVDLAPWAWAFAALGSVLALVQLLVVNGIAARSRGTALLVAAAVVVETALVSLLLHDGLGQVVGVALAAALLVVLLGGALLVLPRRGWAVSGRRRPTSGRRRR